MVHFVNSIVSHAIRKRASDIHFEPGGAKFRVRCRIDGFLLEVGTYVQPNYPAVAARIKVMADMDIAEKRLPQDGRIHIAEFDGRRIDIRVATLPTIFGEKVVMRILDKKAIMTNIHQLGFSAECLAGFRRLYSQAYGMVLVTGPTGSGKTTTLYSVLTEINSVTKNIITIEDPVEYRIDGTNQIQVNTKSGMTFANGLRSILRQDPDVIMVGEIRDKDTADIAVRAALTGHLVLTTLHTNDAAGAITRLIDMGIEPYLVASSVLGVLAQRLVRLVCPECRTVYQPAQTERELLQLADTEVRYRATGCNFCGQTGYYNRTAIYEVLPLTAELRETVKNRVSSEAIRRAAIRQGMTTMQQDGMAKVGGGQTTLEEVMRVVHCFE
ncbi:general secretory pathway protein E [Acetonema longum DSM 6540]|uniref:General secretory pathway protein E n=1 Tax=Acetonema longum DSM 6540 TaxID=1009370 RepID=F7NPQ7_9FIRM|nr:general secretory pathway protein E [Acetonema longum DSM 6540]